MTLKDKTAKTVKTQNHIFIFQDQLHSVGPAGGEAGELQLGRDGDLGFPPTTPQHKTPSKGKQQTLLKDIKTVADRRPCVCQT